MQGLENKAHGFSILASCAFGIRVNVVVLIVVAQHAEVILIICE